jgi:hypothetical protein
MLIKDMADNLPVYNLIISDDPESEVEVDFIALVDRPAIERNFLAFNAQEFVEPGETESESEFIGRCIPYMMDEGMDQDQATAVCYSKWEKRDTFEESYSDYPDAVKNNAKAALKWADENGWGSCGTPVGKQRANDLAAGRPVSLTTIKRMYSFLSRHKENAEKSKGYGDGCGQLMYDAWGGASALSWAESKINQAERARVAFAIQDEEQRIISGPIMVADRKILRADQRGEYFVVFPKETIKQIAIKFFKKGYQSNINLMHDAGQVVEGVTMFESWIKDSKRGIPGMEGFEDVPEGSWFGSFKVDNEEVWSRIKAGEFRGVSVEGIFNYTRTEKPVEEITMAKVIGILESMETN